MEYFLRTQKFPNNAIQFIWETKNVEKHFYTKEKNKIASAHVNAPIALKWNEFSNLPRNRICKRLCYTAFNYPLSPNTGYFQVNWRRFLSLYLYI